VNILDAINDDNLFKPFLGNDHTSWQNWKALLSATYGLPIPRQNRAVVRQSTGRKVNKLPANGFDSVLLLTGRRSGKSRIAAVAGAFEAVLAGHEKKLARGEKGVIAIIAPTRRQAKIVKGYIRALFEPPLLEREVVSETGEGFELLNSNMIEILAGDFRTVRGYTLIAAIVDEAAFFGVEEESRIRSDTELIRAVKPALATVGGKLIAITTPYAKKGWCYSTYKKHYANDNGKTLVWNCPSRTMNPTLPQSVVDEALAEDLAAAKAEYLGEFRDDVAEFLTRSMIESLVVPGRKELLPKYGVRYVAFVDMSGGRNDDAALAIAHNNDTKAVIDFLKSYRPPYNPHVVIKQMAEELKRYGIRQVTGDQYAAEFTAQAFESQGIRYRKSPLPKSGLYLELLPRMCSGEIELPDDDKLVSQLAGLERRTRSGGKDIIDHAQGAKDDAANAVAGVSYSFSQKTIRIGAFR